jgi:hypothetical protein
MFWDAHNATVVPEFTPDFAYVFRNLERFSSQCCKSHNINLSGLRMPERGILGITKLMRPYSQRASFSKLLAPTCGAGEDLKDQRELF